MGVEQVDWMDKKEDEVTQMYDEMLDEFGPVDVAGLSFYPSRILSELDPIAYRTGLLDYAASLDADQPLFECEETGEVYEDESEAEAECSDDDDDYEDEDEE